MGDFLLQLLGLVLLFGAMGFGYWRWVRPYEPNLTLQSRGLLLLVILTLMGGFIGSPFWWVDEVRSFSWDLPPLASRMLAAAGWSFVVVSYLALRRPSNKRLRLVLILLFVYLFPLTIAILLFHLDRFDFSAGISYAFFAIVGVMDVGTAWYLLRQPTVIAEEGQDREPTGMIVRVLMILMGVVIAVWGLALMATDSGPISAVWVWPGDLLTSRLIGVMLLAIASGLFYSFRYKDVSKVMLGTLMTYSVGLAAASLWNLIQEKPFPVSYFGFFTAVFLVSLFGLILSNQSANRATFQSNQSPNI